MLRGGSQASAEDNNKQQQQLKQKKRLSFKEPEVERSYLYGGWKSKTLDKTKKTTISRKTSSSVEDLTLEDHALQIAQHVGNAFSDLSGTDNEEADYSTCADIEPQRETEIRDNSPPESPSLPTSCLLKSFKLSAKDQEFLDALVPPLTDDTMRAPSVQSNDLNLRKECIPIEPSFQEVRLSSSAQHQIQMLKYQLEQQNQQTQMVLHQVQLLQDQMEAESLARRKAQEQNNQLMHQNKELLSHMEKLFQQIEELERQILTLEQEKRGRRRISSPENQISTLRQPASYTVSREQPPSEKNLLQNRNQYTSYRRSSLTSTKPQAATSKSLPQSTTPTSSIRKNPIFSSKPFGDQTKSKDTDGKGKDNLKIADSPPVISGTFNPFSSNWKLKSQDTSSQFNKDKSSGSVRSSFGRTPPVSDSPKSTLFGSNLSSTTGTTKKHSSSTSDLYTFQRKSSLTIEEPTFSVKTAVSNLSLSTTSKLPRYQAYTGWQRRTSLTGESDQVSSNTKDSYKNSPKISLFNR